MKNTIKEFLMLFVAIPIVLLTTIVFSDKKKRHEKS